MENAFSDFTTRLLDWMRRSLPYQPGNSPDAEFNALAVELFGLQYQHNPAYQRICRSRKISPETISSWRAVPFIPTEAFKELELTSIPAGARTCVFHSSGTTGQKPSRHFHSLESLRIYDESVLLWFRENFAPGSSCAKYLSLTPSKEAAPHSSLVHMFEQIARTPGSAFTGQIQRDGSWNVDFDAAIQFLKEAMERNEPVAILGTAFNFVHLLDELAQRAKKLQLPAGSWLMETGGYKGRSRSMSRSELHALMSERLGIQETHIVCEYGMSELSSQAYDRTVGRISTESAQPEAPRVFRFPPWVGVQLIDPETGWETMDGDAGLVRVFDLANVYSVAAVQTEDLAIRKGDGFELLGRLAEAEPRGCSLMTTGNP
jgi:hypothetical protein